MQIQFHIGQNKITLILLELRTEDRKAADERREKWFETAVTAASSLLAYTAGSGLLGGGGGFSPATPDFTPWERSRRTPEPCEHGARDFKWPLKIGQFWTEDPIGEVVDRWEVTDLCPGYVQITRRGLSGDQLRFLTIIDFRARFRFLSDAGRAKSDASAGKQSPGDAEPAPDPA